MCCSCRLVCGPAILVRLTEFASYLRLRLLGLELEVSTPRHVETPPEKGLVDLVVLDGEVVIPAPVGGELRHEEVARPIRFKPDFGCELERHVLMLVEVGVEHVVGEDGSDLGLGEQEEGPKLHADRNVRIEIVAGRGEDAMARGIELRARDLRGCFSLLRSRCRSRAPRQELEFHRRIHLSLALPSVLPPALVRCRRPCRQAASTASPREAPPMAGSTQRARGCAFDRRQALRTRQDWGARRRGWVASCGSTLPRNGWPVAYCAPAGADAARSRAAARAPAALIVWRRGKDATLDRRRGAETSPRVHPAVDRESLGEIELTGRLDPFRNGAFWLRRRVLALTGP